MRRKALLLSITVLIVLVWFVGTIIGSSRPQLGLDLQGGVSVVLFPVKGSQLSALSTARDIIENRVNGLGVAEPEVNVQGNTIVIDLPGAKNRDRALSLVGRTAELQFRPVQNFIPVSGVPTTTTTTAPKSTTTIAGATTTTQAGATTTTQAGATTTAAPSANAGTTTTVKGNSSAADHTLATSLIAASRPAGASTTTAPPTTPLTAVTTVAGATTTTVAGATSTTVAGATTTTGPVATTTTIPVGTLCKTLITPREQITANATIWAPVKVSKGKRKSGDEGGCYQLGPTVLTGKSVRSAKSSYQSNDPSGPGWGVDVVFRNNEFVTKIAGPFVGQRVAITLDGVVQSAPSIGQNITGNDVRISGSFSQGEASDLALVLRYGSLPIQFDEQQQTVTNVSPSLGKDQLRAGITAGVIGLALVALYMIFYYRLLGLVVWLGLGLTGMIFFSLVTLLGRTQGLTLTLAGVTGIIVSVGVTVDSYVVYFERLKDEVRSGKTIRSSLDSGFRQAWRTILAADFVSLLSALTLYMLATGSVRGFAYFLGLSTLIDLVLAYFFMHPLVWLMARRPTLVRMRGIGIATGLDATGKTDV